MTHIVFEVLAAVVLVVVLFAVAQYLAVHKAYATSEVIMHMSSTQRTPLHMCWWQATALG
jgi:type IV secretory pathway VirB3-like protein